MRVYLIRHGKKDSEKILNSNGFPDMGLTKIGKKQAHLTGKHLSKINFDVIYSSDLKRANETANIIVHYQREKMSVIVEPRIREINMGVFHTSSEDQIKNEYPEFYKEFLKKEKDFHYPNGESGEEVKKRVLDFLKSLDIESLTNVCVVCHGGVIRSIISYFLGLPQFKRFNLYPYNCGINILEYDSEINCFKVITVNEVLHLDKYVSC